MTLPNDPQNTLRFAKGNVACRGCRVRRQSPQSQLCLTRNDVAPLVAAAGLHTHTMMPAEVDEVSALPACERRFQ